MRRTFHQTSDIYAAMKMCSALTSEAMLPTNIYHAASLLGKTLWKECKIEKQAKKIHHAILFNCLALCKK